MTKNFYSLGLMSGTSIDGIDASIIKSDGEQFLDIVDNLYLKYGKELRLELKSVIDSCSSKDDFKKRYATDADNVKFGTATNIVKKKLNIDGYEGARNLVDRLLKQEKGDE